jgi:hypothetical protein
MKSINQNTLDKLRTASNNFGFSDVLVNEEIFYGVIDLDGKATIATILSVSFSGESETSFIYYADNRYAFSCGIRTILEEDSSFDVFPAENRDSIQTLLSTHLVEHCPSSRRNEVNFNTWLSLGETASKTSTVMCKHVSTMMAELKNSHLDNLKREYNKLTKRIKVSGENQIENLVTEYGFKGEALLVIGPGGHGKTHTIKAHALDNNYEFVELQGHPQLETIDMMGYLNEAPDGSKIWLDGPVAEAARKAASGIKTILFIDEFLNIPMRETAGLKASFEPFRGNYMFQTGRIVDVQDGIGKQERIICPIENLQIITAANMGAGYLSEELDKALKQRFLINYYEASEATVKKVLTLEATKAGFSENLVDKLLQFQSIMQAQVNQGLIPEAPTMRHLSRKVISLLQDESDLASVLTDQALQWCEFTYEGKPVIEQLEIIETIIEEIA